LEQRRAHRYSLQLPLEIVRLSGKRINRTEQTRNISSGGVCFLSPSGAEVGGRIEYVVTLHDTTPPVKIRCLGTVLRSLQPVQFSPHYEVACTMDRYSFVRLDELEKASLPAEASV
jgi:hypothetical protein